MSPETGPRTEAAAEYWRLTKQQSAPRVHDLDRKFAEWLHQSRTLSRVSQTGLAKYMVSRGFDNFHQPTIARIEQCKRPATLGEAWMLAYRFGEPFELAFPLMPVATCSRCADAPPAGFTCNLCGEG